MKRRGIPVVPGSNNRIVDEREALEISKKIGFSVILKASTGGGGKGMRIVHEEKDFIQMYHIAQKEAFAAFGNGDLYIEKYISEMRHIEIQILADNKGNVVHLGERDCSIQRRHQKLIEEAPYVFSNPRFRKKLGELAIKVAKAMKYRNAGTVEFILDKDNQIYFMEINTRIQVEHPVTEMITNIDIVKEQIKLAAGETLSIRQQDIKFSGHSMECRVNAEDPEKFIPSPGTVSLFVPPGGHGVRTDTAVYSGWKVPSHYDSLIAIEGIKTTIPFYLKILDDTDFISGNFNTHFIENNRTKK
jgi:acetyl-CoA carboxylase biotin carboxylase subunit